MPAGRPTGYKPEFCKMATEFLAKGFSVAAFAGSIPVAKSSVYKWMDEHPEFSDAIKEGQARAVLFWEKANINLALTGEGNATAIVFGLKNRAPEEWRDKTEVDNTSSDGSMSPKENVIERIIIKPEGK